MKRRGFQDATFESTLDATSQALHAAHLKDPVRSLNAKSALTIGDSCLPLFPEVAIHASALHWALALISLNAKSALTIGDLRPRCFPKRQSMRQLFIGL